MRTIARILSSATRAVLTGRRTTARLVAPYVAPGVGTTWDTLTEAWSTYSSVTWADWT